MVAASPPTGRYQLVILGHEGDPWVDECADKLDKAISAALAQFGDNPRKFLIQIGPHSGGVRPDPVMPSVGVFFGRTRNPALSTTNAGRLNRLASDGHLIIPVVQNLTHYKKLVPSAIERLNGVSIAACGAEFERLAARVLEGLGLLRESRRLFISYRRTETSHIAGQLYEALDESGFDVFLDTHGVLRPGEPFQEVLWHRLADTDVAVLLDSPGFMQSKWTEAELAQANTSNIQILQVLWPGQTEQAPAAFSFFHPLSKSDFIGSRRTGPNARLHDRAIAELVDAVESLRAKAIGERHAFLIREFVKEAAVAGLSARMTLERAILISKPRGKQILVQPAVGVPDAVRFESLESLHRKELAEGRKLRPPSILLYDETGLRARWIEHLLWLNGNLTSVQSISLAKASKWLTGIRRGPVRKRTMP